MVIGTTIRLWVREGGMRTRRALVDGAHRRLPSPSTLMPRRTLRRPARARTASFVIIDRSVAAAARDIPGRLPPESRLDLAAVSRCSGRDAIFAVVFSGGVWRNEASGRSRSGALILAGITVASLT